MSVWFVAQERYAVTAVNESHRMLEDYMNSPDPAFRPGQRVGIQEGYRGSVYYRLAPYENRAVLPGVAGPGYYGWRYY